MIDFVAKLTFIIIAVLASTLMLAEMEARRASKAHTQMLAALSTD